MIPEHYAPWVQSVLGWGFEVIAALQSHRGPVPDNLFRGITLLGTSEFYYLLLAAWLWCVDSKLAGRLGVLFFVSSALNAGLKDLIALPRPCELMPALELMPTSGYALPSGHAQSAVVVWGGLALWGGRRWLRSLGVAMVVLIGVSRVYLGVHFPTDVLVGWLLGALLLALYASVGARAERAAAGLAIERQLRLAVALPLVLLLLYPRDNVVSSMAALGGFLAGLALERRCPKASREGSRLVLLERYLVGVAVFVGLYLALWALRPEASGALHLLYRLLSFAALWLWVSLGAPLLFRRLRLMGPAADG